MDCPTIANCEKKLTVWTVWLSPHDPTVKKELYQRAGVREYWIIDPSEHTLEQLVLLDGKYQSNVVSDEVHPKFVEGVVIDLAEIW